MFWHLANDGAYFSLIEVSNRIKFLPLLNFYNFQVFISLAPFTEKKIWICILVWFYFALYKQTTMPYSFLKYENTLFLLSIRFGIHRSYLLFSLEITWVGEGALLQNWSRLASIPCTSNENLFMKAFFCVQFFRFNYVTLRLTHFLTLLKNRD